MWKPYTVDEILDSMQTGKTPPSKERKYFDGNINWYTPADVGRSKLLVESSRKLSSQAIEDKKAYLYPKGSLLLTCIGEIGRVGILNDKASSNQQITALTPRDGVLNDYLYYWFLANQHILQHFANNAVVPILNNKQLCKIKIPLPPLPVQKRIAAILDAADAYRQKTKALIEKYDQLTQSLFLEMFGDPVRNEKGWEIGKFSDLAQVQGGFAFKSKDFVEEGVPIVKIANVHHGRLDWDEVDYVPIEFTDRYNRFSLDEGDLLIALTRPIIKSLNTVKLVQVSPVDLPSFLNQRVARMIPTNSINAFLKYLCYTQYFKNQIVRFSSTSLQPNVSTKEIEGIPTYLPPKQLQQQFSDKVKLIENQIDMASLSLDRSHHLFQSILQRAFKGELVN